MRRHPGYALGVILTLGIGVGVNSAMFRLLDRLLFQPPMHVEGHEQVKRVTVERVLRAEFSRAAEIAYLDYADLEQHGGFAAVAPYLGSPRDPWALAGAALSLLAVAAAASLLPGMRATRVDATEALRTD
jgi:ABC-type lipoprotein release transport system permease subunit